MPLEVVGQAIALGLLELYRRHMRAHLPLYEHMTALGLTRLFEKQLAMYVDDFARFLGARPDVRVADLRAAAYTMVHAVEVRCVQRAR
jgi:hypothetical protein